MKSFLFVCTGNTCRSAMAEAIFKDMLKKDESLNADIKIQSAGVFAIEGDEANDGAVEIMTQMGIDIGEHSARRLTPSMIRDADIILAMTRNHKNAILSVDPSVGAKTYTLAEYGAKFDKSIKNEDLEDPYGQEVEVYRQSADDIKQILEVIIENNE